MSGLPTWLQEFLKWLWEHLGELGLLLGGIGSIAGYYFSHWKAELADPASLKKLRPHLDDSPWRTTYRRTLDRALDAADWFFGPPISWRAYGVCLSIAVFYPILLFLVTWVLGGPHEIGGLEVLPQELPVSLRAISVAGLALCVYIIRVLNKSSSKVDAWIDHILSRIMPGLKEGTRHIIRGTVFVVVFGVLDYVATGNILLALIATPVFYFPFTFTLTSTVIFTLGYVTVVGYPESLALGVVGTLAVSAVVLQIQPTNVFAAIYSALVVAGTLITLGRGLVDTVNVYIPGVTSIFIFLFILPVLNAALDTVSWAVSRWLGREMLDRNFHQWGMVGFAVLDAALAFVFLCGLAILLGAGGEAVDQLAVDTGGNSVLDLDTIIAQATIEPFGDGLWITLMLFSTLVPTVIHAFVAIGSVMQMRGRKEARAQWRKEADEALANDEGLDPHACRKIPEHWLLDSWLPSALLILALLAAGWFAWQASVLSDALLAAVEWGRSLVD